jgi:hypothetical protein
MKKHAKKIVTSRTKTDFKSTPKGLVATDRLMTQDEVNGEFAIRLDGVEKKLDNLERYVNLRIRLLKDYLGVELVTTTEITEYQKVNKKK